MWARASVEECVSVYEKEVLDLANVKGGRRDKQPLGKSCKLENACRKVLIVERERPEETSNLEEGLQAKDCLLEVCCCGKKVGGRLEGADSYIGRRATCEHMKVQSGSTHASASCFRTK